jgi:serine phosphatase RsbU (regulator of sigma subunit)/anti-sigma regulatory factor (Ser/Thr protein kinase)
MNAPRDWPRSTRGLVTAAAVALGAPAVATVVGLAGSLEGRAGSASLYLVAILAATYVGGIWFGLVAGIVSYVPYVYYFVGTTRDFDVGSAGIASLLAFTMGLVVVGLLLLREQSARQTAVEAEVAAAASAVEMERLQRLAALLAGAARPAQIARIIVSEGTEALRASAGWVSVLDEKTQQLELISALGYAEPFVEGNRRIPLDADHVAAQVARTGTPLWLERTSASDRSELKAAHDATRAEALALVPLRTTADEPLGFIALRFSEGRSFDEADRELLQTFARQASEALQRARLYEAERRARRVATHLQSITASLLAAVERDEVVTAIVEEARVALAAESCYLYVPVGDQLRLVGRAGHELLPVTEVPAAVEQVAESGTSMTLDLATESTVSEAAVQPLALGSRMFGILLVLARGVRAFESDDRALLESIAQPCALALERADLYQRESIARRTAQLATQRLVRLQAMTAALATAVTVEDVTEIAAGQGAAAFGADAAAVHLLGDSREALTLAAQIGYPPEELARIERIPMDAAVAGVDAVQRSKILWFGSRSGLERRFPAHAEARTPWEAMAFVPLVGREGPLGLLTLSFGERRPRRDEDRALLATIGRQSGQALERARLYDDEQNARAASQRANERLRALEAVAQGGLQARTLDELIESLLPLLRDIFGADRAALLLVDDSGRELRMRAAVGLDEAVARGVRIPIGRGIAGGIAASGTAVRIDDVVAAQPVSYLRRYGGSLIGVPLRVDERVMGVLHITSDRKAAFEDRDVRLLALAGDRFALALERMSLYEREHHTAVTLQRSVLPTEMPDVDGVRLAARYVPGSTGVRVGGDWYDAIDLGRGRLGVAVGDVVGKGVLAAATMAQLRNALRVYATEGLKPSTVLAKLNRLADATGPSFATILYAVVDTKKHTCRYASAGHPPPLLVRADGSTEYLEGGRAIPIGVHGDVEYRQDVVELEPGDALLLYTDGLVERRGSTLDAGLERLQMSAGSGPASLQGLVDHVVEALLGDQPSADDVAVLALAIVPETAGLARSFPAEPAALAEVRSSLRDWLEACNVPAAVVDDVVLASSEACANAVEHAERPSRSVFDVNAEKVGDEIVVRVRDYGRWREPRVQPDRGFGLRLIEGMVDAIEIDRSDGGTEVLLRRRSVAR